ncbi:integrase [Mesorhizobium sp. Root552]|jgi:integrase|uniref:tyrosine-type recombinase/integrase n=1 Tax=Mesorhizobium sp. Root552 TaxID=1736555 RepID=UPI0007014742|nr:site-specific integrase [Mesorhizobium sp. Root552]KQZ26505.1 integrase [Mesorhizobium sp. Root552]
MADIRKRTGKKGTNYQVRYPSSNTSSGYAFATFSTLKEARAFTENLGSLKSVPGGTLVTVAEAVDRWLNICEKIGRDGREKVEPETLKEYRRRGNVMKEYAWPKPLHEIEAADVVAFRSWLLENKTRDLARRVLSSFHSVVIEMRRHGFIQNDPAAGITIKTGGRYEDDDAEVQIPSDAEMRAIYEAADRLAVKNDYMQKCWARYRPLIYLAGFTGMRPSEYRGLSWSQVAADHVVVRQRADATGIIGPVKSRAGRRTLYLPALVSGMLAEWRTACPVSNADLVFPTALGKPMMLTNFRVGCWDPLMREAGLMVEVQKAGKLVAVPKYTPYALRHYFASKLIETGKDLKFIQNAMGHSKIEITFNVYGHLIRGREEQYKLTAEELAQNILGSQNSCGKSVARTLQAAE